jgi:hypothetical protein
MSSPQKRLEEIKARCVQTHGARIGWSGAERDRAVLLAEVERLRAALLLVEQHEHCRCGCDSIATTALNQQGR